MNGDQTFIIHVIGCRLNREPRGPKICGSSFARPNRHRREAGEGQQARLAGRQERLEVTVFDSGIHGGLLPGGVELAQQQLLHRGAQVLQRVLVKHPRVDVDVPSSSQGLTSTY